MKEIEEGHKEGGLQDSNFEIENELMGSFENSESVGRPGHGRNGSSIKA